MKLSELIATLTKLQREHGDVDVYVHNDMIGDDPNPEYFPTMSESLRDRIAAVQAQHHHWDYAGALACACGEEFGRFGNAGWEAAVQEWAQHVADAVIAELDSVLVDFGLWLTEEITGRQMARIDLESCLTDWKADDE